jgi:putative oxidoreductase
MEMKYLPLFGRLLLATIFLLSGLNKIASPEATQQYMAAMGMGWTGFFLGAAIIVEVGAGLSLLLGYWTRTGATVLFLFMIPTTLIFHTNFADQNQMIHFLKNVAIMGGLLYVVAYGPGALSLDARRTEVRPATDEPFTLAPGGFVGPSSKAEKR